MRIALTIFLITMIGCSSKREAPKKGITRFFINKIAMPGGREDRFLYANDTLLSQAEIYQDDVLVMRDKYYWSADHSLSCSTYDLSNNLVNLRTFSFTNGIISWITIPSNFGYSFEYRIYFDDQKRLDHYEYGYSNRPGFIEKGFAQWLADGLNMTMTYSIIVGSTVYPPVTNTFEVKSIGENGSSVWYKLSPEALSTVFNRGVNIIEYFVPNQVIGIKSPSYGYYTYDKFEYDVDGNLISIRRTDSNSNKIEYFSFEWKKVLL
jgi:hypothetical protein